MIAAYKVPIVEEVIARLLIKVDTAILANLVVGEKVVPEFLQRDCTPEKLAAAVAPLLTDSPQRRAQLAAFAGLDEIMEIGKAVPSARAATAVLAACRLNQTAATSETSPDRQR
jgi:lipid-A-disaccharide synthase